MADINYDPFNDVTDPDAAVAAINTSLASLFPPTAINPFVTLDDLASIKQMNTARLLGRFTAGIGAVEEITIGANLTLSVGGVLSASGGGGGGTLAATLILGNTTGANDIIISAGQVIKDAVLFNQLNLNYLGGAALTSTAGIGIDAAVEVSFGYSGLSNAGDQGGIQQYTIGVELFNDGTRNINNSWSTGLGSMVNIGVSPVFGASFDDYQDIVLIENSTLARTVSALGTRRAVFIATRNSTMNAGITRSAIIGGNGIIGAANDTVYLGNNLRVVDTANITTLQHISATATTNLLPTGGQHAILNMTGFGIGGSPTINLIGSNSGTAAINVFNGSSGVNNGAFKSWVSTPGSPFRNSAIGIQKNSVGRILLWQQVGGTADITLLANTSDNSTTINVGIIIQQDTVAIQRIHNLGAPPVYTAKLNIGGSTTGITGLAAVNIEPSLLIPSAPGAGDMWYNGTDLFLDNGALTATTRQKVARVLTATGILNFGSTPANSSSELTLTVTGAANQDVVALGVDNGAILPNSCYTAWVSAANTVTVRFNNYSTAGAQDPANGQRFKVTVFKNV
jgi:hypothetical protein